MSAVFSSFAQTSATGGQGFNTYHPPTVMMGGDPKVADHWFRKIEKIFEVIEITSNATKIRLAAFQLEGESQVWWDWVKTSRD